MTTTHKEVVRRYTEGVFGGHQYERLGELLVATGRSQGPLSEAETFEPDVVRGIEGLRLHVEAATEALPDASVWIDDRIADGDSVAARSPFEGYTKAGWTGASARAIASIIGQNRSKTPSDMGGRW